MTSSNQGDWAQRLASRIAGGRALEPGSEFVALLGVSAALAAAAGIVLAVSVEGETDWETVGILFVMGAFCGSAVPFLRIGRPVAAAWVVMLAGTLGTTVLLFTGRSTGFDDIAIMVFAILTIAASVMFDFRHFLLAQLLVVGALAATLVWQLDVAAETGLDRGAIMSDAGFSFLIVTVTGISSHFLAASLRTSIAREEEHQRALRGANELLERRNAELERFAYTISHELKSPLVTIGGFLPLVRKRASEGDVEGLNGSLSQIEQAHGRMTRLLADLLDLCRLGFLPNATEEVPFGEIVEEARAASRVVLAETGLEIEVLDELPAASCDRARLVEVMQNLFENASRFTREATEPRVEVGVRGRGTGAVIFVRDNGVGIPTDQRELVFELFRTLHPDNQGTGVGLAIARRIIELHDGRIWVDPPGDGAGATFCISLPWTRVPERSSLGVASTKAPPAKVPDDSPTST